MSLTSAIALIVTVIILYYVLISTYTVLLRITGMTKEKARFQSISLLTNAGFTTSESEILTGEKTRRNIAICAMISGYFFSVVIVSLVINLFLTIDFKIPDIFIPVFVYSFGGLMFFLILVHIPSVKKFNEHLIEDVTVKIFKHTAKDNYVSVLDSYGTDDAVCKVFLYKLPKILDGKKLCDTDIKKLYNVNILMVERNGKVRHVDANTIFSPNDTLLVFGPLQSIMSLFVLHDKKKHEKDKENSEPLSPENSISIIDNYDYQVLSEIELRKVPELLKGKTLISSHIKDIYSINVMMVSRNGSPIRLNKDTILLEDDKVIAFGPIESINTVFGERNLHKSQE